MFVPRAVQRKPTPRISKWEKQTTASRREEKLVIRDLRAGAKEELNDASSLVEGNWAERQSGIRSPKSKIQDDREPVSGSSADEQDEEPVISYSKQQRWPTEGEPVCVECGRYGAYIVDQTDHDVCSLECKAHHLQHWDHAPQPQPTTSGCHDNSSFPRSGTYLEHPAVATKTEEEICALRTQMQICVRGDTVPKPITDFADLFLPSQLNTNLLENGFLTLTPVQMQVIPAVLCDRDVIVSSATGSGKTLSFLLPVILQLFSRKPSSSCLILSPTRELCMQIEELAKQLMKGLPNLLSGLLVGGLPLPPQLYRLKTGVQLMVATPARMHDILTNHSDAVDVSIVRTLVLDEVDSLLQLGFESQVRNVIKFLPAERQTLMFSATIPPRTERLAADHLSSPLFISVGTPSAPCAGVRHTVLWVEENVKKKRLFAFLTDRKLFQPPAVVFVNSRKGSLLLADAVNKVSDVAAVALHGEMTQERRSSILAGFLGDKYELIIATGVLARGLDLQNVKQVFNFDMPASVQEFTHQIGRAGRLGSPGWAITFINNENKGIFADLVELLEPLQVQLPPQLTHSPHLSLQQERRKRKNAKLCTSVAKKGRDFFYNQSSLIDLIQGSGKSCTMVSK